MSIKKIFVCIIAFFCLSSFGFSQSKTTKVKIVHANSLSFNKAENENARKLKGDVELEHDNMLMYCDSALIYNQQDSVAAFGHIKIIQNGLFQITGDSLFYNNKTLLAKLRGKIILTKQGIKMTTNYLNYDKAKNLVYYFNGAKLYKAEDNSTLTAKKGTFFINSSDFLFKDSVRIKNNQYRIAADSIIFNNKTNNIKFIGATHIYNDNGTIFCKSGWYNDKEKLSEYTDSAKIITQNYIIDADTIYLNQKTGVGNFHRNVNIRDTNDNLNISGNLAAVFQNKDSAMVTKDAILEKGFLKDTLFLHADTFKIQTIQPKDTVKQKNNKILYAYNHIRFYKNDMQGVCDSLVYSFPDSLISMFKNPILWSDSNQLTGDTISIFTYDTVISSIYLRKNAFIISQVDSIRFNQIKGISMRGHFSHNKLSQINVMKNAETVYYILDDNKKFIGVNKANAQNLIIRLNNNQIKSLTFVDSPKATLYPLKAISPDRLKLKYFEWHKDLRPKNASDIF